MIDIRTDEQGHLSIVGEATIFNAPKLRELLLGATKQQPLPVALDLSGLESLDTAGAQLLIAFKRELQTLPVHSCPSHVRTQLEHVGLVDLLL